MKKTLLDMHNQREKTEYFSRAFYDAPWLNRVVTLTEAARIVSRHRKTVLIQIWKGTVKARDTGGVWLVDLQSLTDHYGDFLLQEALNVLGE
jgi:hypothetical protein